MPPDTDTTSQSADTTAATASDASQAVTQDAATGASATTVLDIGNDKSGEPGAAPAKTGDWPENWRDLASNGDEKVSSRLSRYASPKAAMDALIAAQNRISAGQAKAPYPKDGKPEDIAAWRAENGIPDAPEKYDLGGLKVSDSDKPMIDAFLKSAHEKNMTPDAVKGSIEWYAQNKIAENDARIQRDNTERQAALDTLNSEWGTSFRTNITAINNLLAELPDTVKGELVSARLGNGTGLFNSPDLVRWMLKLATDINPAATVTPAGHGNPMQNVEQRIGEIEKTMRTNRSEYNRDEKMQNEYRQLLDARLKMSERKAA